MLFLCFGNVRAWAQESGPWPRGHNLQARLEIDPEDDRAIVRVVNASNVSHTLDIKTVHYFSIKMEAVARDVALDREPSPDGVLTQEVRWSSTGGEYLDSPGRIAEFGLSDSIYGRLRDNPVTLGPGEYIGNARRFTETPVFGPLAERVARAGKGSVWKVRADVSLFGPGPGDRPARPTDRHGHGLSLPSSRLELTRKMIDKALRARRRALQQEKAPKEEPRSEDFRLEARISLPPHTGKLMLDVVLFTRKLRPIPIPHGSLPPLPGSFVPVDMATLSDASCLWRVKAGTKTLYETDEAEGRVTSNRSVALHKYLLVGRIVRFSGSPVFRAIQGYFEENDSPAAKCTVSVRLELYVPGDDGKPRRQGELVSNEITVTREDYKRIAEATTTPVRWGCGHACPDVFPGLDMHPRVRLISGVG